MFYTVTIVDTIHRRDNAFEHRLVEYQVAEHTSASAKIVALEHHLARTDRSPLAAVRWAIVGGPVMDRSRIVQTSERAIDLAELLKLEERHYPYVIA
jgi:antitoxin (DNA-binding transcriptional repressor) of toxin-antitoxin stability system